MPLSRAVGTDAAEKANTVEFTRIFVRLDDKSPSLWQKKEKKRLSGAAINCIAREEGVDFAGVGHYVLLMLVFYLGFSYA